MLDINELNLPAFLCDEQKNITCFNNKFTEINSHFKDKLLTNFRFYYESQLFQIIELSANTFIVLKPKTGQDQTNQNQIVQDQFEQHQSIREATRHSMALQMRILNELGEGVFIQDKNEKIIFLNPSAEKILEYASYEIVGKSFLDFIIPEEEKIRVSRLTKKLLAEKLDSKPLRFETQIKNKGNETIYLLVYYSIMWTNKKIEGALITIYDISDIKNLTKEIQERSNELLQAEKLTSIGLLASGISHELNNPLSFIISNTSTLEDYVKSVIYYIDTLEESVLSTGSLDKENFQNIRSSTEYKEIDEIRKDIFNILQANQRGLTRLSDVISDLRTFSHINRENSNNEKEIIDIIDPIKLALNLLSYELKSIDVQLQIENENKKYLISGNTKLYQIFLNILYNASQAINEKFPLKKELGIIQIKIFEEKHKIVIQIADNGIGIDEKNLPRLFDPFYTTKPPGIGTGLGLSISQRIINDLGGYILAESGTIMDGAAFTLYFPAYK